MNDYCGCCTPPEAHLEAITNRPGLSSIRYRIGTYGRFREALLRSIATSYTEADGRIWRPLRALSSRTGDDPGILVLEMWAYLADILTFYQERYANEFYLRTAEQRAAVRRLAALLNYTPSPGLAATTLLAFTAEPGAHVQVPVGLRVQSVPDQDAAPQKFETVEPVPVRAPLNRLRIYGKPAPRNPFAAGSTKGALNPDTMEDDMAPPGSRLVAFTEGTAGGRVQELTVEALERVDEQTVLRWQSALPDGLEDAALYRWHRKFKLFGYDAPAERIVTELDDSDQSVTFQKVETDYDIAKGTDVLDLAASVDDLAPGATVLVVTPAFVQMGVLSSVEEVARPDGAGGVTTRVTLQRAGGGDWSVPQDFDLRMASVYELDGDAFSFWPFTYPDLIQGDALYVRLPAERSGRLGPDDLVDPRAWALRLRDALRARSGGPATPATAVLRRLLRGQSASEARRAALDALQIYDGTMPPSEELLQKALEPLNQALEASPSFYNPEPFAPVALDPALRRLGTGATAIPGAMAPSGTDALSDAQRKTTATARRLRLNRLLLEAAFPDLIRRGASLEGVEPGRRLLLTDRTGAPQAVRVAEVWPMDVAADGRHVVLRLDAPLERSLQGDRAVAFGNVTAATHGETVAEEVVGNGDASANFQSFELRKRPVTFIPDATAPRGAGSTLSVRVEGVRWEAAPTLYGQHGDAPVYLTEIDDEQHLKIRFGDGTTGARLPTGRGNVTATYRHGLGRTGNMGADRLTTLLDRPKGLKAVTNPLPASGGAAPETREALRRNAPSGVRLFGRIVSLRDFAEAARAHPGVAKVRASWQWSGADRVVRLVVAGNEGEPVTPPVLASLRAYLDRRRTPHQPLRLIPHRNHGIYLTLALQVDERYASDAVVQAVREAILEHFAFANRQLGQPVHLSDLYQVIHGVEGVVAADVNALRFADAHASAATGTPAAQYTLPLDFDAIAAILHPSADLVVTPTL